MEDRPDFFLIAGEPSGDRLGAELIASLRKQKKGVRIVGVGGPRMRKAGLKCLMPMEELEVMGFIDVLLALPRILRRFYHVKRLIESSQPHSIVFIDYQEFNLRLARSLSKSGNTAKKIQYICPSVWAWRANRTKLMEGHIDRILSILPFERDYFMASPIQVSYIGHPLQSRINHYTYKKNVITKKRKLLAIFPGSRTKEINRNLPLQLTVARQIADADSNIEIALSCAHERHLDRMKRLAPNVPIIPPSRSYELMRDADFAIATSGTVTLELALHAVPTVVTFAITPLDLFIAQKICKINLPHYALPNIIAGREVFPELFGPNFTQQTLRQELLQLIENPAQCIKQCKKIADVLGDRESAFEAGKLLLEK